LADRVLAVKRFLLAALLFVTACSSPQPLRILFVGNSHTYGNDVPGLIQRIAASKNLRLETDMLAVGGYTLRNHFSAGQVQQRLETGRFAAMVLQEQSGTQVADVSAYKDAAAKLTALAQSRGVRVYLYMGWTRQDLVEAYGYTQSDWTRSTLEVADVNNTAVAPVGEAWSWARRRDPAIALQEPDGNHATLAGAYIAACTLFYSMTGISPLGVGEKLTDIALPLATASALEGAALDATLALEEKYRQPLKR
jgi:hypothetical protein